MLKIKVEIQQTVSGRVMIHYKDSTRVQRVFVLVYFADSENCQKRSKSQRASLKNYFNIKVATVLISNSKYGNGIEGKSFLEFTVCSSPKQTSCTV